MGVGLPVVQTAQAADVGTIKNTAGTAAAEGAASQAVVDGLDDEREEKLRDYKVVINRLEDLREYNGSLRELIEDQAREMASLEKQIGSATTIERDLTPLMLRMLESLETFVELDAPFLQRERTERVARLRQLTTNANVSVAEKFRKVIEAYQIENEYGRTIEAYRGRLGQGDEARTVDFLKVGRVAFYYQTLDREETAMWDVAAREWRLLDSGEAAVRTAMNVAREIVPPDLLELPLPGPQQASAAAGEAQP